MNVWDFSDETAKTGDLNKSLVELLELIKKMPRTDVRTILEVSTANLAVSMGVVSRMDALMNSLKGLVEDEGSSAQSQSRN